MQSTGTAPNDSRKEAGGAAQPAVDSPLDARRKVRSLRILVADEDPALCQFYEQVLARLGHQVCMARTGRQLVELCRSLQPDFVIAGIQLSDLDGIAAAEQICRDRPTPIILLPGDAEAASVQRTLANPYVLACLVKPVKEADLGPAVAVALRRFEQLESLHREAADLRQALEDRKLVERAKEMLMRYAGFKEEEAYYRLRKACSNQNRKLVEIAQTVLNAGEVFRRLEQPPHDGSNRGRA